MTKNNYIYDEINVVKIVSSDELSIYHKVY